MGTEGTVVIRFFIGTLSFSGSYLKYTEWILFNIFAMLTRVGMRLLNMYFLDFRKVRNMKFVKTLLNSPLFFYPQQGGH